MRKYILSLDQGTTGTTALLINDKWEVVSSGYEEVVQIYPKTGWVEQDGVQIFETLVSATQKALDKIGANPNEIKCIGLANQGETIIAWDKLTGEPVYNAIVWQDKRTCDLVEQLNATHDDLFLERTGLKLDAYFGATKIKWILENQERAKALLKEDRLMVGALDSWLIFKLTGGKTFKSDFVTGSRTCLMNVNTLSWDNDILQLLEIPKKILPELVENVYDYGNTSPESFLGATIPITASIVDQQSALIGQGCLSEGEIKATYGTGCFVLMNTGCKQPQGDSGLLSTLALVYNGERSFALDGGVYIAGAATKWLVDKLKIAESPRQVDLLAESVEDNGGVYFVPAFSGLGAPYWDSNARGTIVGLTGGSTNAHLCRATLESIAYQVKDVFDTFKATTGINISALKVDGGSTKSDFLMQFQADVLGIPVIVPENTETTGFGVAILAGLKIGVISSLEDVRSMQKIKKTFTPKMTEQQRENLTSNWQRAVERAKEWKK